MAADRYHDTLTEAVVAGHKRSVDGVFKDSMLLSKEWNDLASSFAEDPKTTAPEAFLGSVVKFLELFDRSRVELAELKKKEAAKQQLLPALLQQDPGAPQPVQANAQLDALLTEQEKQAEISKRAMAAVTQDPLMSELLANMNKMVKDRRTLRANKREKISTAGATVIAPSTDQAVVVPIKQLTKAFDEKPIKKKR